MLKSFRAISLADVELKTNISEISSVSIISVDVVNVRMSLIYIYIYTSQSNRCIFLMVCYAAEGRRHRVGLENNAGGIRGS
jgi:hypothetical protein